MKEKIMTNELPNLKKLKKSEKEKTPTYVEKNQ